MKIGKTVALAALLAACSLPAFAGQTPAAVKEKPAKTSTKLAKITWDQLIPPVDPVFIKRYESGDIKPQEITDYLETLGKQSVGSLNGVYTKMPGYLVPLNMNEKQISTELLLVPSAGSCIHVPPPPPNQTIYVKFPKGIKVEDAGYTPYWVQGRFKVETKSSEYTDALYVIEVDEITEWN